MADKKKKKIAPAKGKASGRGKKPAGKARKSRMDNAPAKKPLPGSLAFYLLDSAAFLWVVFTGVQNNLLWREGLYEPWMALFLSGVAVAVLLALHAAHNRFAGESAPGTPRRARLLTDIAVFLALSIPPALFTFITPQKGKPDFAWLPLEWHKLPENVVLLARVTPGVFTAEIAAALLMVWLLCSRRHRIIPALFSGALAVLVFRQIFVLTKESNIIFYFFQYVAVPLAAFVFAVMDRPRWYARTAPVAMLFALLLWQYIGFVPVKPRPAKMPNPAVSVVYPDNGEKAAFPLVFFRDFYVDGPRGMLFTAFGPTSGVVRLDLATRAVKIAPTPTGLVRYVWTRDELPLVYAIDWIRCDLMEIDKASFRVKRRDIYRRDASIPLNLEAVGDRLYVSATERPGLTEYDLHTMKVRRTLDLQPYTSFHSGVWRMKRDEEKDRLFVEMGYTDMQDRNRLLRIDRKRMKVDGEAWIPAGGLELLIIPEKRRIVSASFFTHSLWEYDMDTMKFARRIEGPLNCRNMAWDSRRGLIYALSFLGGELRVIRYSDGKTIRKLRIGNKASSLFLMPGGDELYLGSSWGVLRVDLEKFLEK